MPPPLPNARGCGGEGPGYGEVLALVREVDRMIEKGTHVVGRDWKYFAASPSKLTAFPLEIMNSKIPGWHAQHYTFEYHVDILEYVSRAPPESIPGLNGGWEGAGRLSFDVDFFVYKTRTLELAATARLCIVPSLLCGAARFKCFESFCMSDVLPPNPLLFGKVVAPMMPHRCSRTSK